MKRKSSLASLVEHSHKKAAHKVDGLPFGKNSDFACGHSHKKTAHKGRGLQKLL